MKKIILVLWVAVLTFASCDNWLNEDYYGAASPDEMVNNEDNLVLLVGQAYADVKWLHDHWGYWGINTLTSDECVCPVRNPGGHWNDGGYWKHMNTHEWTAEDDAFENVWNTSISGAVLCNKILADIEPKRETVENVEVLDRYIAELKVLRTYYFYTIFDCFGRIPYTESFVENPPVSEKPLMEAPEVWKKLVACLEDNKDELPKIADNTTYGRATWGFANALLARLYLNAESYGVTGEDAAGAYSNCARVCQDVISSGLYQIESDFFTNFKINNEDSRENIFVIVEDGRGTFDVRNSGSMMNKLRVTTLSLHYQHQEIWNLVEKPWNGFSAPKEFIDKYAPDDKRGPGNEGNGTNNTQQWGWFVGPVYNNNGQIAKDENKMDVIISPAIVSNSGVATLDSASWNAGARILKYEIDKTKKYQYCENDFVLFRYADILYMQAEAFVRGGTCEGATLSSLISDPQFQLIRTRAGQTAYTAADLTMGNLDELLDERGREFAWENVRHRDLVRFGKFQNGNWDGWGTWRNVKSGAYLNWFPIPGPILRKSTDAVWTQNEGYIQ